jgi:hypothetical protein
MNCAMSSLLEQCTCMIVLNYENQAWIPGVAAEQLLPVSLLMLDIHQSESLFLSQAQVFMGKCPSHSRSLSTTECPPYLEH